MWSFAVLTVLTEQPEGWPVALKLVPDGASELTVYDPASDGPWFWTATRMVSGTPATIGVVPESVSVTVTARSAFAVTVVCVVLLVSFVGSGDGSAVAPWFGETLAVLSRTFEM